MVFNKFGLSFRKWHFAKYVQLTTSYREVYCDSLEISCIMQKMLPTIKCYWADSLQQYQKSLWSKRIAYPFTLGHSLKPPSQYSSSVHEATHKAWEWYTMINSEKVSFWFTTKSLERWKRLKVRWFSLLLWVWIAESSYFSVAKIFIWNRGIYKTVIFWSWTLGL